jgi:FAD/FMN-containing dehydrogenase
MTTDNARLIEKLRQRLGPGGILTDPADTDPYCEDWRRLYHGRTPAVLRPANTAEVADAVRFSAEARVPIVPMGGNTSMVGGAAVREDGSQIVLTLSRMTGCARSTRST